MRFTNLKFIPFTGKIKEKSLTCTEEDHDRSQGNERFICTNTRQGGRHPRPPSRKTTHIKKWKTNEYHPLSPSRLHHMIVDPLPLCAASLPTFVVGFFRYCFVRHPPLLLTALRQRGPHHRPTRGLARECCHGCWAHDSSWG